MSSKICLKVFFFIDLELSGFGYTIDTTFSFLYGYSTNRYCSSGGNFSNQHEKQEFAVRSRLLPTITDPN